MNSLAQKVRVIANSGATLMARLRRNDGTTLVPADVNSVAIKVYDDTGKLTATLPGSAYTIFSSLQVDARWVIDSIGYQFAVNVPGTAWTKGNVTYRVEAAITPAVGNLFFVLWDCDTTLTYNL